MASDTDSSDSSSKKRRSSHRDGKRRSSKRGNELSGGSASERDSKRRSSRRDRSGRESRRPGSGDRRRSNRNERPSTERPSDERYKRPPSAVGKSDESRAGEMARKCTHFRYYMLYTSGGWLGDLLMTLTDLTGIWEFNFLAILFVMSWTVLRTGQVEITLTLGHVYDLIIPLQHQFDPHKQPIHSNHLEQYWPIFFVGLIIEFASFVLVHPDLFTLVACVKTLILLGLWLGRDKHGRFLTEKFGGKGNKSGRSGHPPLPGRSDRGDDGKDPKKRSDRDRDRDRRRGREGKGDAREDDSEPKKPSAGSNKPKNDDSPTKKNNSNSSKPTSGDTESDSGKKKSDDETASGVNGKHPYDSRGFDGNLMPIRKKLADGPKQSRVR
ncbi:uncharacterized protein I303_101328 [Kwoniella dejecticola CBS 10117]|uniref:Transmembrane protein n=1 Tax=Kwoniella dejecticola CBS 10117 TaxID=1296121 RepID=A0A1A6AHH2_9TREE|nr:uncharacterized protein I303_01337 [Kwoniella dejecticola CBS 10117]OBR89509.1 hypothetical protein I303_01337 [Kwoniella dejecticola CBS 10117]